MKTIYNDGIFFRIKKILLTTNQVRMVAFVVLLFTLSSNVFGQKYWIGNNGEWNDSNNWSTNSGGTPDTTVPSSNEMVVFDQNSGDANVTANLQVGKITLTADFTGTVALIGNITAVIGSSNNTGQLLEVAGGTFDCGSANITSMRGLNLSGGTFRAPNAAGNIRFIRNFTQTGGIFDNNLGTVELGGSQNLTFDTTLSETNPFWNVLLNFSNSNSRMNISNNIFVDGNLTINAGTVRAVGGSSAEFIAVAGNVENSNAASSQNGLALKLIGATSTTLKINTNERFNELTIDKSSGASVTINIDDNTANAITLTTVNIDNGELNFGDIPTVNLIGSGSGFFLNGGTLTLTTGITEFDSLADFVQTGGTWNNANGTVSFLGSIDNDLNFTGSDAFYNVIVNKSSGSVSLLSNIYINNNLTVLDGNMDSNNGANRTVFIQGNVEHQSDVLGEYDLELTGDNSEINFNSSTTNSIINGEIVVNKMNASNSVMVVNGSGSNTVNLGSINIVNGLLDLGSITTVSTFNTVIDANGYLSATNVNFNIDNDFTINNGGTYTNTGGVLEFSGNTQTINVSPANIIQDNIKLNSSSLVLDAPFTLDTSGQNIDFADGQLITSATNVLTIGDDVTVSGGSVSSFVNGPMVKVGDDAFTFPVGDTVSGAVYAPVTISSPSQVTDAFTVEYFDFNQNNPDPLSPFPFDPTAKESGLDLVYDAEYWQVDRTNGTSNVTVTLSWNNSNRSNYAGKDPSNAKVVRWDSVGMEWTDAGNTAFTGTRASGSVTSEIVNDFSPFAIGSVGSFITTWNSAALETLTIPTSDNQTNGIDYNFRIDWGDGATDNYFGAAPVVSHQYADAGNYTVQIDGVFPRILLNNGSEAAKLTSIEQWGDTNFQSMRLAFYGASNLEVNATDVPDLSEVFRTDGMFYDCTSLTDFGDAISTWDVSSIQIFQDMFRNATSFDKNLANWDLTSNTNMNRMFLNAGLSLENYDNTLIGWATDSSGIPSDGIDDIPSDIVFDGGNSQYCNAEDERNSLNIDFTWTITDAGRNCPGVILRAKAYLQGAALNPNIGEESLMRDDLRIAGFIPTISPYGDATTINASVLDVMGNDAVVDWVLVELRDKDDNTNVVVTASALLQRDGDVVNPSNINDDFKLDTPDGDYFITIKHRNHLGVMSANAITLNGVSVTSIDFTDTNTATFGTNALTQTGMPSGILALWAGNANSDDAIIYAGANSEGLIILSTILGDTGNFFNSPTNVVNGYLSTDVNMDGQTKYLGAGNEQGIILTNVLANPGNIFNAPTNPINEQLPNN